MTTAATGLRRMPIAAGLLAANLLVAGCAAAPDLRPRDQPAAGQQTALPAPSVAGTAPPKAPPKAAAGSPEQPVPKVPVRSATAPKPAPQSGRPRSLTVQGTSINMTVVAVGVARDGAMEIPDAFNEAGWYRHGPAPGSAAGTAVIAAHVDTTSDLAPFSQLKTLRPGAAVVVGRDRGAPLRYRVVSVGLMAKDKFDGGALFRRDGPPLLKLVTCGGRWLDAQQDYSDNVIVTAAPE